MHVGKSFLSGSTPSLLELGVHVGEVLQRVSRVEAAHYHVEGGLQDLELQVLLQVMLELLQAQLDH
jgi:hypothetical protein